MGRECHHLTAVLKTPLRRLHGRLGEVWGAASDGRGCCFHGSHRWSRFLSAFAFMIGFFSLFSLNVLGFGLRK